ncbi:hypothetical protein ASPCADRAFT_202422, partial [Aspergillus carbonarius ITEM 5010]
IDRWCWGIPARVGFCLGHHRAFWMDHLCPTTPPRAESSPSHWGRGYSGNCSRSTV